MNTRPTTRLDAEALADALTAGATGCYGTEAAIELLIEHGTWLHRRDFVAAAIRVSDDEEPVMADVDWTAAITGEFPCSSTEAQVLRIAGQPTGEPLRRLLAGLDDTNSGLVLDAVAHACGWHTRHLARTVTGHPGGQR
jgi:hypothetical protein